MSRAEEIRRKLGADLPTGRNPMRPLSDFTVRTVTPKPVEKLELERILEAYIRNGGLVCASDSAGGDI